MRPLIWALALTLSFPMAVEARSHPASDYYTNASGHRVHRPIHSNRTPAGASAKCEDGTYSFSEHHQGTCSHHGGVEAWL
jgi:hypothetical protein